MGDKVNKCRVYFYLFVVILIIGFAIVYAFKNTKIKDSELMVACNERLFAPWPPDLVPHIRELEEEDHCPPRGRDESRDDYNRRKQENDELRNIS